jgi:hypothetical protein
MLEPAGTWEGSVPSNHYMSGFEKIGGGIIRLDQLYFKYLKDGVAEGGAQ